LKTITSAVFDTVAPAKKASLVSTARAAFSTMVASARKAAGERHLRSELAAMDDNLLRDIGVADEEIHLIRAGQVFTPRAWAAKSSMVKSTRAWTV
jgi:uncharacterized protein YjiS (DUF1127 family)